MELWVLVAAFFCWLGYTLYFSALLLKSRVISAEIMVYIFMGNQSEVAEWFVRNVYKSEAVLTGHIGLAIAVDYMDAGTFGVVKILSREKEFNVISNNELPEEDGRSSLKALVMDVRGMNMNELLKGPLKQLRAIVQPPGL